jgi:leader peptidase (prepilin peptidase)/N-methyltransferase
MTALVFFLIGLPAAFLTQHLIRGLSNLDEVEYADAEAGIVRRRLPWQTPVGAVRIRFGVAALVPAAFVVAGLSFGPVQACVVACLVTALLICLATDLLSYRVPDVITYPATALALVAAVVLPEASLLSAVAAAVLGGGVFLVISLIAPQGGFGLGDVKLAVLIGAALGLPAAYQALFVGMFAAGVVMLLLLVAGVVSRRQAVPYAPFLALSAAAFVLVRGAAFAPL